MSSFFRMGIRTLWAVAERHTVVAKLRDKIKSPDLSPLRAGGGVQSRFQA